MAILQNKSFPFLFLAFILLLSINKTYAQEQVKCTISGTVLEEDTKEPIPFAHITLKSLTDSTYIQRKTTNTQGYFSIETNKDDYHLEISFLGFEREQIEIDKEKSNIKLDSIFLKESSIELQGIEITATPPAMQVRGDTIEFNALAYNIDGSSKLLDLIKQVTGLSINKEGALVYGNKVISKILLDGKEYFGNDIQTALNTLPASMVTKLQLFQKESKESTISGIKDIDPDHVINIKVKDEYKRSTFGEVKVGTGTKERYVTDISVNRLHNDNQYALVGNMNNIMDFDDTSNKSIGTNINLQSSETLQFSGSAYVNQYKTNNEYWNESYLSALKQYRKKEGYSSNRRDDFSFYGNIEWQPDSLTTVYISNTLSYNRGKNYSNYADSANIANANTTLSKTDTHSSSNGVNLSFNAVVGRKLDRKGRNLTLTIGGSSYTNNSKSANLSETNYLELAKIDTINQKGDNDTNTTSFTASVRYVEPLTEWDKLTISYSLTTGNNDANNKVMKWNQYDNDYSTVDSSYTRKTEVVSTRQDIRLGYQRQQKKMRFGASFSIRPYESSNKISLLDSIIENTRQKETNFAPALYANWEMTENSNASFSYSGSTNYPRLAELSADTIVNSPTNKTVGNPDLKLSFSHQFSLDYRISHPSSGRSFSSTFSYMFTDNSISGYQLIDAYSNTINTYRNVNGNSNYYYYLTFDTPLKNKNLSIGTSINGYGSKNTTYLNQQLNVQKRHSIAPSFYFRMYSPIFETNLNIGTDVNFASNNLADEHKSRTGTLTLNNTSKIKLPYSFNIESDLDFTYRHGYGENVRKTDCLWNLAVSKLFFKDKRGEVRLEMYDVLNNFRALENTVSGSDYSNYWRKVINHYFVASFVYRFEKTSKPK